MKVRIMSVLLLLACLHLQAQQKYWIYVNEKNPFLNKTSRESSDEHLRAHGFEPVVYSAWLNAISVELPDSLDEASLNQPCIQHWEPVRGIISQAGFSEPERFDAVLEQIHGDVLTRAGYTGEGIRIGVIDAGFHHADRNRFLKDLVEAGQVKGYRNFIEPDESDPFVHDFHGTRVLTHIAGSRKERETINGLAVDAWFYLARTDQANREYRGEEDYWVAALEWMYAQGVRIVNSSLGYSDGYDDPAQNYVPENADGKTSAITRAAAIAVKEKGMILVISAGNEGNRSFRVVSLPADAEGVLSVGASTLNWPWTKQGYSSVGTPGLAYVKPDVACFATGGTSYSAPVITGLVAAIWQARPDLTNVEVARWIRQSGHLAAFPNNYMGHGVPDARKILQQINGEESLEFPGEVIRADSDQVTLPGSKEKVVIYHKRNAFEVNAETVTETTGDYLQVFRPATISRSTVVYPGHVIEVIWD